MTWDVAFLFNCIQYNKVYASPHSLFIFHFVLVYDQIVCSYTYNVIESSGAIVDWHCPWALALKHNELARLDIDLIKSTVLNELEPLDKKT